MHIITHMDMDMTPCLHICHFIIIPGCTLDMDMVPCTHIIP